MTDDLERDVDFERITKGDTDPDDLDQDAPDEDQGPEPMQSGGHPYAPGSLTVMVDGKEIA